MTGNETRTNGDYTGDMINVSATAASKIHELLVEEHKTNGGLRVYVQGGGFTIKNPNATSTCGCGSSFSAE